VSNPDNCVECNRFAKWSAWRNKEGQLVCPRCVDPKAAEEAILRVFPNGIPENLE
jgi:hypothetical protein